MDNNQGRPVHFLCLLHKTEFYNQKFAHECTFMKLKLFKQKKMRKQKMRLFSGHSLKSLLYFVLTLPYFVGIASLFIERQIQKVILSQSLPWSWCWLQPGLKRRPCSKALKIDWCHPPQVNRKSRTNSVVTVSTGICTEAWSHQNSVLCQRGLCW